MVLIGFFVLVSAAIALRAAVADSTGIAAVAGLAAVALIAFGVQVNGRPGLELRVSPEEIVLASPQRIVGRIGRDEAGGEVMILKRIIRGHAHFSVTHAGLTEHQGLPLDGFRMSFEELRDACSAHGWRLSR